MKKRYTDYVNVFTGNGEITPEAPQFPANTWHMIKGLSGNTTPAATLPFGKYSCLSYDGAYPAGYGINAANTGGSVPKLYDQKKFIGLSHFHHSGTGAIGKYYCYALSVPYTAAAPDFTPRPITRENAAPGYYSCETEEVFSECTVSESIVCHRYRFNEPEGRLFIDFANNGLLIDRMRGLASGKIEKLDNQSVLATMSLEGLTVYFLVRLEGARFNCFYRGEQRLEGENVALDEPQKIRFGADFSAEKECALRMAVSFKSREHAFSLLEGEKRGFEEIKSAADEIWNEALGKIDIETDSPREKEIFYSNLYHTLVKPADCSGEGFLFDNPEGEAVCDVVTMWDIYKTQLPLLFTLYPEISRKLLKTLERYFEKYNQLPHCLLLSNDLSVEAKQARMLAEYSVCDAYYRGVEADYKKLLEYSVADGERFLDAIEGEAEYASHILDVSEAFSALGELARALGDEQTAEKCLSRGKSVQKAFDSDGMMRAQSVYYEGNRYNYSFRPLYDMKARIETASLEVLRREAEKFFGFTDSEDITSRFEGFNNETDMESPYFLHFIGLRREMSRVLKAGMDCMFTQGSGGIPGNADSGGLTACYLWSVMGVFPMSGFDKMIVGLPRYKRVTLRLDQSTGFIIEREGEGEQVGAATLNGEPLSELTFPASLIKKGGTLKLKMI